MPYARVFQSGNSQAVRLPKQFRVNVGQVEIFRQGDDIVLRQGTAATYLWVMSGAAIAAQGAIPNPGGTWQLAAP